MPFFSKSSQKKSSPDKSASLSRNSSLRSASNDASIGNDTNPILEVEFKYFQDMLGALKQRGDMPIKNLLKEYKNLHERIQKSKLLDTEKSSLLFKICEEKAVIAWQKEEFSTHAQSLKEMFNIAKPSAIIALERWQVEYKKNINENAKSYIKNIETLYKESLIKIKEEVNSLLNGKKPELNGKKYDEAVKKLEYLTEHSNNFQIFAMRAKILIKQGDDLKDAGNTSGAKKYYEKAYQCCQLKLSEDKDVQYYVIHDTFKELADKFSVVGDTKLADEAASYASKYKPDPIVATASAAPPPPVNPRIKQLEKTLIKVSTELKTARTLAEQDKELEDIKAKHKADLDKTNAEYQAELKEVETQHKADLEALRAENSLIKDTKVGEVGDSSTSSSLLSYSGLRHSKKATTASTAPVVTPLDSEVLTELTKLANLIPSLEWYDSKYDPAKDKAKKLLNEAVEKNPDVYKEIENPKILVLLADALLSLNKMEKARIVCEKALELDPNIWETTNDQIVLLNLAGVLLSSNQPKAEQIYSKAISMRIYFKDEHGNYEMDNHRTTIVSKTVAQDEYSAAERECLVKVCLSSDKIYQKVQALDCYPHTDVNKRQEIAEQLKQLAKQMPLTTFPSYQAYTLYSKAFSVLKDNLELSQDMKKTYEHNRPYVALPKYSSTFYPPTEESTAYLIGECANSDY